MFDFLPVFLIIVGSMLIAIQIRLRIVLGKSLGSEYKPFPVLLAGIILLVCALMVPASVMGRKLLRVPRSKSVLFAVLVVALAITAVLVLIVLPDISQLQVFYFCLFGFIFGILTILWAPTPARFGRTQTFFDYVNLLWENRMLLWIWTHYNVRSRYSQTFLGILWIILLPLSTSIILTFVFTQIFRAYEIGDVPFISFFLSALTAWTLFSQGIINGTGSIMGSLGLISQVYFPREILVIVKLLEAMVDFVFTFVAMLVINAVFGLLPNPHFVYLPVIIFVQIAFVLGLMLFISYLSVLVRDIPQLVNVLLQLLFYLTPILYPASAIPDKLRFMLLLNPMAPIVEAYRTIIVYNKAPDFVSLYYPITVAGVLLYVGYMFFKRNEKRLADYV
ncbi:MAG TPA: ABC transporter permease [Aggregatilineales bacterium]|nr:ABC transporter permease [Aggregatilineales bacterium]